MSDGKTTVVAKDKQADQKGVETTPALSGFSEVIKYVLSLGLRTPPEYASLLRQLLVEQQRAVVMWLNQTVGNAFVQQVAAELRASSAAAPTTGKADGTPVVPQAPVAKSDHAVAASPVAKADSAPAADAAAITAAMPAPSASRRMRVQAPNGLHVRSSPSTADATNIIGTLKDQDGVTAKGDAVNGWLTIDHGGKDAYVDAQYVVAAPAASAPPGAGMAPTSAPMPAPEPAPSPMVAPAPSPAIAPAPSPAIAPAPSPAVAPAPSPAVAPAPSPAIAPAPSPAQTPTIGASRANGTSEKPAQPSSTVQRSPHDQLIDEAHRLVELYKAGSIDYWAAFQAFYAFEIHQNGGQESEDGHQILGALAIKLGELAAQTAAAQALHFGGRSSAPQRPGASDSTSSATPTIPVTGAHTGPTPYAIEHPGAATFETIQHTRVEANHGDEGDVLTKIRAFSQQFEPHWLLEVQEKLQVGDATGAFNTETLRALRATFGKNLNAKTITDRDFLISVGAKLGIEGEPFRSQTDVLGHEAADPAKTDPADIAAQAAGYADYHSYQSEALHPLTFLDIKLKQGASDGRAHPLLASRVAAAEAYLVQRFGSKEKAIQGTGWSKRAGAAYAATDAAAHDPKDPKSHMHTMGMAIDIDPNVNPYTMPKGDGESADWIYWFYTTGFELGHRLGFGGDALNLSSLYAEGKNMSTEELAEHMLASSKSFARVVEMSEQPHDAIKTALLAATPAYAESEIKSLIEKWFDPANKIFHDKKGNRQFHETMTESKELLVALRDAAGLNWGGTEMSMGQNGDFMHFDTRNDDLGKKVYDAGYQAQQKRKQRIAKESKK